MNKRFLVATAALALLAVPGMAHADDTGWYIRGNAGAGVTPDLDLSGDVVGDTQGVANAAGSLGLGYEFDNNWRLELDGSQFWNKTGLIGQTNNTRSSFRITPVMLNAIYDFNEFQGADGINGFSDFLDGDRWEPYIGAGIGLAQGSLSATTHELPFGFGNPTCQDGIDQICEFRSDDTSFAWQLIGGLGYAISDNLNWDTQYRYLNAGEMDFDGFGDVTPDLNATIDTVGAHMLLTGLRYTFGHDHVAPVAPIVQAPAPVAPAPAPIVEAAPAPVPTFACWDGTFVTDLANCRPEPAPAPAPQTYTCWDGSLVYDQATCPAIPAPVEPVVVASAYNNCGPNPVAIFNVDLSATPKPLNRLGTMPEFGDSHGLTPNQFFEKLQAKYAANENGDRAYLNYLFKSMGYSNGFSDAQSYMFSEDVLPVGTTGLLGLGEIHHYAYHVLPNNDRDRQAFRIQSANGSVIHFMKTCGNYMYACN